MKTERMKHRIPRELLENKYSRKTVFTRLKEQKLNNSGTDVDNSHFSIISIEWHHSYVNLKLRKDSRKTTTHKIY